MKNSTSGKWKEIDLSTELAVGGVTLATMGVIHAAAFSTLLRVNIFDYASATDFVVFSFRNWIPILLTLFLAYILFRCIHDRAKQLFLIIASGAAISAGYSLIDAYLVSHGFGRLLSAKYCVVDVDKGEDLYGVTPIGVAGLYYLVFEYDAPSRGERSETHILTARDINSMTCARE